MKRGLLVLGFFSFAFLMVLLLVAGTARSMEQYLHGSGDAASDAADVAQLDTEAAYAQTLTVAQLVDYFRKMSDDKGAPYAYEVLRHIPPSPLDPYKHLFGHIIGDKLYDQQKLDGLDFCTPEFTFACYHSLISRGIAEQGLENIDAINQRCLQLKDVGSCQHGIGHGIMAAMQYEDPVAAIKVCDSLEKVEGVTRSCIEGVIMEFNFHQVEQVSPVVFRPVDERGYNYPCTALPEGDQDECFFEQMLWWRELVGRDNYSGVAALCEGIENEGSRTWCYRGIGRLIPEYSTDPVEVMATRCIEATSLVEGQALCLQMLRDKTGNDGSICDLLDGAYADVCRSPLPEIVVG